MTRHEMRWIYVARLPLLLAELRRFASGEEGSDATRAQSLGQLAHRIRGAAATFGLTEVSTRAAELEGEIANDPQPALVALIGAIAMALAEARGHFQIALALSEKYVADRVVERLRDPSRELHLSCDAAHLRRGLAAGAFALAILDRPLASDELADALPGISAVAAETGATVLMLDRDPERPIRVTPPGLQCLVWPDREGELEGATVAALQAFALRRAAAAAAVAAERS